MTFSLVGFSHIKNVRHFLFERVAEDRTRVQYSVDADLGAVRAFRIATQELPLLCRRLLDALPEGTGPRALTLSELDMRQHAAATAAAQASATRKHRPVPGRKPGQASTFGQSRLFQSPAAAQPGIR
jgi:hypothetical protein